MANDYYDILGVDRSASDDELKKAFRQKVKQYHPDLHPGDAAAEAKFKEVNEAYTVLSDKEKRARYDQFGKAGVDGNGFGGGAGYGGFSGAGFEDVDLGDIFNSFFGGGASRSRRRNGPQPYCRQQSVGRQPAIQSRRPIHCLPIPNHPQLRERPFPAGHHRPRNWTEDSPH